MSTFRHGDAVTLDRARLTKYDPAFDRTGSARRSLAPARGVDTCCLTYGQFSVADALRACLDVTGPARLCIATWTTGDDELERIRSWMDKGDVTGVRFLVDRSLSTRHPQYQAKLDELFGEDATRAIRMHAKVASIVNADWQLALRTTANLNHNTRLEWFELSESAELAGFFEATFDAIFGGIAAGDWNAKRVPRAAELERRPSVAASGRVGAGAVTIGPRVTTRGRKGTE